MHEKIQHLLSTIEKDHQIRILYACESGSRAWGFQSPNSDYDIRFIYHRESTSYLSLFESPDTIELPIIDDLDPSGWDIKKSLSLLAKSNGQLIEWLHSPIVYIDRDGFRSTWQALTQEVLQPSRIRNHYLGLAKNISTKKLSSDSPSAKAYLYTMRSLLAARWVEKRNTPPPVAFADLMKITAPDLKLALQDLVQKKASLDEVGSLGRIALLDNFIQDFFAAADTYQPLEKADLDIIKERIDREFLAFLNSRLKVHSP